MLDKIKSLFTKKTVAEPISTNIITVTISKHPISNRLIEIRKRLDNAQSIITAINQRCIHNITIEERVTLDLAFNEAMRDYQRCVVSYNNALKEEGEILDYDNNIVQFPRG